MAAAVVTGGARGMGLEIARRLANRGYRVTVADVDGDAAATAAAEIGGGAEPAALDVRDRAACERIAAEAASAAGGLAVWVNSAGILRCAPAWEHSDEERRAMFDVNVHGLINGTLTALGPMRAAGRGHVINLISLAGLAAPPGETIYAATKHAALAFSLGTLYDLREAGIEGVHVSSVCPDGVWTPMLYEKVDDPHAAPSWSGVMFEPGEVADRVVGLLDRPRPVLVMPRWRGVVARAFAAFPTAGERLAPRIMERARRKQAAWAREHRL
jgi:NAD(P)-dependent dehydrogenase (short-subunit alcohol dehydrogenase family)